ncbi:Concanavalin A-like lectin/glucanase [Metarhizium rileyi]|uniref:Concanavalin A-like lectin/glucanase n=1 Tax=Metarhizium rileyi (strain RCEF 4871) TaxID=1649241 RepID=A0A166WM92_METRR|nr:Concanavalin A-like lectin/glucanase [Metarhizium rileyi RCEF 4871]
MPWRDKLKGLKADFEGMINARDQGQGQGQGQDRPPPPPPMASRPPRPCPEPTFHTYWVPRFYPDTPVNVEWDAKLGNGPDGWGNQELEHYTAAPENSFQYNHEHPLPQTNMTELTGRYSTPNGQLVIRALANNSSPTPEQKYTSARLVSRHTLERDQGVLTAVIMSPCADGIWPAFWLLPQEPFNWPVDGEIDIAETWNGDGENRSCLHWGQHHEPEKHRVLGTKIHDMHARPVRYDFAWHQPGGQAGQGRMIWYIDDRPVMKAPIPEGTRSMRDMTILLNVAMGGNVCGDKTPADGYYDMVVYTMYMASELENGGWGRFESDWGCAPLGNTY